MARINSPSSIITYLQCPRLYYYKFVEKRPSFLHIDLIKGRIIHESLKDFFYEKPPIIEKNYDLWALEKLKLIFLRNWSKKKNEIQSLNLNQEKLKEHKEDCVSMLDNWSDSFLKRIKEKNLPFKESFEDLKPIMSEESFVDESLNIKGFIDVIEKVDEKIRIIDYKTSSSFDITQDYKIQLSIYAYLYKVRFNKNPDFVGIYFLRDKLYLISVDDSMIEYGRKLCEDIKNKTLSEDISKYPQGEGYLCKRLGGKCQCYKFEEMEE